MQLIYYIISFKDYDRFIRKIFHLEGMPMPTHQSTLSVWIVGNIGIHIDIHL